MMVQSWNMLYQIILYNRLPIIVHVTKSQPHLEWVSFLEYILFSYFYFGRKLLRHIYKFSNALISSFLYDSPKLKSRWHRFFSWFITIFGLCHTWSMESLSFEVTTWQEENKYGERSFLLYVTCITNQSSKLCSRLLLHIELIFHTRAFKNKNKLGMIRAGIELPCGESSVHFFY